jgi:uncharacterized lipoprotein YajG
MKRILFYLIVLLVSLFLLPGCQSQTAEKKNDPFGSESFKIKRGTNVGHWLSLSRQGERSGKGFLHKKM